jgi:2-amino-4-hydroxy-6-hydroxymethyldihydropteridine diphosphokinase
MAIYVGLGANLDHPNYGKPRHTLCKALDSLHEMGLGPVRVSRWYSSSPVPPSGQPWYVNAVAEIQSDLGPDATLAALHMVEDMFGRVREERNGPRWIDLDLLDYNAIQKQGLAPGISTLPHPRLHLRAFVLLPLADLSPDWRHPVTGELICALLSRLPSDQKATLLPEEPPRPSGPSRSGRGGAPIPW